MSPAIVVAVLVAAAEARSPVTRALVTAATEVLEAEVSLVVRAVDAPSDNEVLKAERELHADAVIQVLWSGVNHDTVRLRVHVARDGRFIDQRMSFAPADTAVERGRALGFTTASILLSQSALLPRREPAAAATGVTVPPDPASAAAVAAASANRPSPAPAVPDPAVANAPSTASATATQEPMISATATRPGGLSARRLALELSAVGTVGLGGPAAALGATAHLEYAVAASPFWVRAGGGLREGSFPGLDGDDRVSWATLGGAWRPELSGLNARLGAGFCMDVGLMRHDLSHRTAGQSTAYGHHVLPGAMVLLEAAWRMTGALSLVVTGGVEAAFGVTEVSVGSHQFGTVPVLRAITTLGIRAAL